jgi:hypothetical protein
MGGKEHVSETCARLLKGCAPTHLASLARGEVEGKRTREETPATTGDRRLYGNLIARVQTERRPVVSLLWG